MTDESSTMKIIAFDSEGRIIGRDDPEPVMVWVLWEMCRRLNQPLPPSLIHALDGIAAKIRELCEKPPKEDVAKSVGEALGFGVSGKGENPFAQARKMREAEGWLPRYLEHRKLGLSSTAAREKVADEVGRDESTVGRHLKELTGSMLAEVERTILDPTYWEQSPHG